MIKPPIKAKGDLNLASSLLERMLVWAEADNRPLWLIRILAFQALEHQIRHNERLGIQVLERALDLAEPDGCVQIFIDMGKPMARLLEKMKGPQSSQSHSDFTKHLLQESGTGHLLSQQTKTKESLNAELIDPLSKRELEVIRLIAEGYSNKEIALRLHVSVRTVKYYTTGIYTKLNVGGRAHAAVKARELGLLG